MRTEIACSMLIAMCLGGCSVAGYFIYRPYPALSAENYWSKKDLGDEEIRHFYWKCYPRRSEMYGRDRILTTRLEIEGQKCMLEHGFAFKDAPYPHGKLCSSGFAKDRGVESYMIFPACQAKFGKYRR